MINGKIKSVRESRIAFKETRDAYRESLNLLGEALQERQEPEDASQRKKIVEYAGEVHSKGLAFTSAERTFRTNLTGLISEIERGYLFAEHQLASIISYMPEGQDYHRPINGDKTRTRKYTSKDVLRADEIMKGDLKAIASKEMGLDNLYRFGRIIEESGSKKLVSLALRRARKERYLAEKATRLDKEVTVSA